MFEEGDDINLPLPIMVDGQEVSGTRNRGGLSYEPELKYSYRVRFTPIDNEGNPVYDVQEVMDEFLNDKFDIWVLGVETKPYTHFHMYIESDLKIDEIKKKVREFIYPLYPERKRGFGNKQYSVLPADNPLNAIIYALKQRGEHQYSGFDDEFIQKCIQVSFDKPVNQIEVDIGILTEEFMTTDMDPMDYAAQLCIIYSKHDKRVHFRDIQGIVTSKVIKRDPSKAAVLVNKYILL